jgi:predicted ATPase
MPAFDSTRPYVFVSYASINRERVVAIVDALTDCHIATWFDREDIPGGTSYGPEIVAGIKNATALLLMCSEASLASRNVRQEIQLAWRHERPILPLLLEPMLFPDDVSYWLEGAQWIEVLEEPPEVWLDQVRYALALMGYGSLEREKGDSAEPRAPFVELPPNNLPDNSEPILGRERELRQIRSLLEHARLVTLTGPGGTGKTRLATQVARDAAILYPDGIWFIDSAPARDAQTFAEAIAAGLDVQESPPRTLLGALQDRVQDQRMLLVLDNLEQIDSAGAVVDQLLAVDGPTLIGTSRAPLRAAGEMVLPISPLEVPALSTETPASVIARNPAVQLFVAKARQVKPDFQLSDGNAFEVASICARLDGLPLAIELAAARTRLLHPAALLARLDNRLSVLTRGAGRSARQQTLQSTIAWSYDLLDPLEQAVFRRVGIFTGGASLELAEEVASAVDAEVSPDQVLDAIDELIDHSLIEIDTTHRNVEATRIRMLETIREFALAMLNDAGELQAASLAHATRFDRFAREHEPLLLSGQQALALEELASEQANITSAFLTLVESAEAEHQLFALGMAGALWRYWWMRGTYTEGMRLVTAALDTGAGLDSEMRARALNAAGIMAFSLGDLNHSQELHQAAIDLSQRIGAVHELARSQDNLGIVNIVSGNIGEGAGNFRAALDAYRNAGDRRGEAVVLDHLAGAYHSADDLDASLRYANESVEAWTRLGDQHGIGHALQQVGMTLMYQGKYDDAIVQLEKSRSLAAAQEDPVLLGNALLNLASALEMSGDPARARDLLVDALRLYEQAGDARSAGYGRYLQGHVARRLGDLQTAREHLDAALEALEAAGQQDAVALCLETLGGLAADEGEHERAASLLIKALKIRELAGIPLPKTRTEEFQQDLDDVIAHLGQARFEELSATTE